MNEPSATGPNGDRDRQGRFQPGNTCAVGNPHARRVAVLRSVLVDAVAPEDLRELGKKLLEYAKAGDLDAARLLPSYVIGKPAEFEDPDRVELRGLFLAHELETARRYTKNDAGISGLSDDELMAAITRGKAALRDDGEEDDE